MTAINELRDYYNKLSFAKRKDFILSLTTKLEKTPSAPHQQFLEECIRAYNEEVRNRNTAAGFENKPKMPDISPDVFAKALATLITGGVSPTSQAIKNRLIGKWLRDPDDGFQYYTFNADGSFVTNEFEGDSPDGEFLVGNFTVSPDNAVLMEPHNKLKFTGFMFSQAGDSLIITLKDGMTYEYRKV
jgi:hypothetical protein